VRPAARHEETPTAGARFVGQDSATAPGGTHAVPRLARLTPGCTTSFTVPPQLLGERRAALGVYLLYGPIVGFENAVTPRFQHGPTVFLYMAALAVPLTIVIAWMFAAGSWIACLPHRTRRWPAPVERVRA
jgi:hypothetical protein